MWKAHSKNVEHGRTNIRDIFVQIEKYQPDFRMLMVSKLFECDLLSIVSQASGL